MTKMNARTRPWLPMALCCLPGVIVAAIVGLSIALGGAGLGASLVGPLGLGLIVFAALACPIGMGLIMTRGSRQKTAVGISTRSADCCAPGEALAAPEANSPEERLAALRARRQALERELVELQAGQNVN